MHTGSVVLALWQEANRRVISLVEARAHAPGHTEESHSSSSFVSALGAFMAQAAVGGAEVGRPGILKRMPLSLGHVGSKPGINDCRCPPS